MKKNHIQLQKGLSLNQFIASYGTEELCGAFLEKSRWTEGYSCQKCGCAHPYVYWKKTVKVFQCSACRKQVTLTENTIFHSTKLSLVQWYQAMYEREITTKLSGSVEIDDAYFGGELRDGKVGRGFENKIPFIPAFQTNASNNSIYAVFHQVKNFSLSEVKSWVQQSLVHDTLVVSDGLNCFKAVTKADCDHQQVVVGSKRKSVDMECFFWINTILGNLKTAITGTKSCV